jgi:hypothetical protein
MEFNTLHQMLLIVIAIVVFGAIIIELAYILRKTKAKGSPLGIKPNTNKEQYFKH